MLTPSSPPGHSALEKDQGFEGGDLELCCANRKVRQAELERTAAGGTAWLSCPERHLELHDQCKAKRVNPLQVSWTNGGTTRHVPQAVGGLTGTFRTLGLRLILSQGCP